MATQDLNAVDQNKRLIMMIETYWADRGFLVDVQIDQAPTAPKGCGPLKSDMVNGLPVTRMFLQ